jgi:CcmD family protein
MMGYLGVAFALAWLGFFLYNFHLIRRLKHLERALEDLASLSGTTKEGQAS